ncbi:IS110 family transposase [Svornostia abyssi]|uniref:IS110 family transposase n=1 Tax=Svornostia abyssi TaxID=2898438 RepID=A0ABY5PMI8_9ACTN|nr:IS110 family transposase [Parviterribacteraceae bacterium J379]UUY05069.1 IS110 family transposase [Parviterribacteraceae bacterium J379]UUY05918.1 IS110 family transposase [Parviterribacteraceae bacterium J379]
MIVIAADTHKSTHSFSAVDLATGRVLAEKTLGADRAGMLQTLRWAKSLGGEQVWALEDCRHVSSRLERVLIASGERVVRVAPKAMGQARRAERTAGKSDVIDARAVARAVVRDGVDSFPAAFLDDAALEIRLLVDHRADLVAERTRMQSRLRWHLVELDDELEARIPAGSLDRQVWLDRIDRRLKRMDQRARVRIARDELRRIRELTRTASALERELRGLIADYCPDLLDWKGCGTISAATLIGRTAGAQRFPTDGHYARHAGTAPIPASSGRKTRQRLNRGGDRQLNAALHRIAVAQGQHHPAARDYLARKQAEGKSRIEAIRCLKRQLTRTAWQTLKTTTPNMTTINANAPAPALALT